MGVLPVGRHTQNRGVGEMSDNAFSRRHFSYGTLLAGAFPLGGFRSAPSLGAVGFKSPNEKLKMRAA